MILQLFYRTLPPKLGQCRQYRLRLTDCDGFEFLQQFKMSVGLHCRWREAVCAAAVFQEGEVEEKSQLIGSGYAAVNIFSHVRVERLWVTLQSLQKAQGLGSALDVFSGEAEERNEMGD